MFELIRNKLFLYERDNYRHPTYLYISENLFHRLLLELDFQLFYNPIDAKFMGLKVIYVRNSDFCEVG
jgi:hypothetical protein